MPQPGRVRRSPTTEPDVPAGPLAARGALRRLRPCGRGRCGSSRPQARRRRSAASWRVPSRRRTPGAAPRAGAGDARHEPREYARSDRALPRRDPRRATRTSCASRHGSGSTGIRRRRRCVSAPARGDARAPRRHRAVGRRRAREREPRAVPRGGRRSRAHAAHQGHASARAGCRRGCRARGGAAREREGARRERHDRRPDAQRPVARVRAGHGRRSTLCSRSSRIPPCTSSSAPSRACSSTARRVGDLLDATFPAGSMTGAPKLSAMTILHGLEDGPRGVFAGCFGWIGDDGALDLAMVIRSIVVHPSRRLRRRRGRDHVAVGGGGRGRGGRRQGARAARGARRGAAARLVRARGPVIWRMARSDFGRLRPSACSRHPTIGPSP